MCNNLATCFSVGFDGVQAGRTNPPQHKNNQIHITESQQTLTNLLLFLQRFCEDSFELGGVLLFEHTFLIAGDALFTDDIFAAWLVALPHWCKVSLALHTREWIEDKLDILLFSRQQLLDYFLRIKTNGYIPTMIY